MTAQRLRELEQGEWYLVEISMLRNALRAG